MLEREAIFQRKHILLAALPLILVAAYIACFGLNIPFLDQWEVVPLLAKRQLHSLSLVDLFAQHNESRPFFPRLIWIALSGPTHYNVKVELWLNVLVVLGTFLFFVRQASRTWKVLGVSPPPLIVPLMSLLVFNLGAHESWLQGYQMVMFLGSAAVIIGLLLLQEQRCPAFGLAVVLGAIATFSMANGLLYWPIGLAALLITRAGRARAVKSAIWIVFGTACAFLFLKGWASGTSLNVLDAAGRPLERYLWTLSFLGAPLMTRWYVAWGFGILGVCLYILILGHIARTSQWKAAAPCLAVAAFVVVSGGTISIGRMQMGIVQAVVPRYLTMSVWYWMSLLTLLPLIRLGTLPRRVLYGVLTASLIVLNVWGGLDGYTSLYRRMLPAYEAARTGSYVSDEALARIHPIDGTGRSDLQFLETNRLSVYYDFP